MNKEERMALDTHARMTPDGVRRVCNYVTDLLRHRKGAVTFYVDQNKNLRELGTGAIIEVRHRQKEKSI